VFVCEYGRGCPSFPWYTSHSPCLELLLQVHAGQYPGMRLAAASSADTPLAVQIGRAAMRILEVVPGVTVEEVNQARARLGMVPG